LSTIIPSYHLLLISQHSLSLSFDVPIHLLIVFSESTARRCKFVRSPRGLNESAHPLDSPSRLVLFLEVAVAVPTYNG
jgi:hypothetical protein